MNIFYYNSKSGDLEKSKPSNINDVYLTEIKTNKNFSDFYDDFDKYRKEGNSVVDSIDLASSDLVV